MQFQLKKISYSERLSQETSAFAADVYVDGKKAGNAENSGHGGETIVHLHLLTPEQRKSVYDWIKQQPPKVYPATQGMTEFTLPMTLEIIVDDLLNAHLDEKYGEKAQIKKWCKKQVVFRLKGDKAGSYRTMKKDTITVKGVRMEGVYSQRQKDYLVKTHGDKLEEIVNETIGETAAK